jgi:vancomycin permeability regulator SanA
VLYPHLSNSPNAFPSFDLDLISQHPDHATAKNSDPFFSLSHTPMKRTKKWIKIFLYLFFSWFVIHSIIISIDGLSDKKENADVAVVLGSKVNEDGTLSERLQKRVEWGMNLYKVGRVKKIIVSGGFGSEGFFEGDKMRDYLIAKGIPDSVIIVDNKGDNTALTAENVVELQRKMNFKSAIVVSQYFHVTRTKMLFRKYGFANVSSVSPSYFEWRDFYSLVREFFGYYSQLI